MKTFTLILLFTLILNPLYSQKDMADLVFSKSYNLSPINNNNSSEDIIYGKYFTIVDNFGGTVYSTTKFKVLWEIDKNTKIPIVLPPTKITIKIIDNISKPIIRFRWTKCDRYSYNIDYEHLINNHLQSIIIYCKEIDFPFYEIINSF